MKGKEKGTLPGYLPIEEAKKYAGLPIGSRPLTVFEEADMLFVGKTREEMVDMTPEELRELANWKMTTSEALLGC